MKKKYNCKNKFKNALNQKIMKEFMDNLKDNYYQLLQKLIKYDICN